MTTVRRSSLQLFLVVALCTAACTEAKKDQGSAPVAPEAQPAPAIEESSASQQPIARPWLATGISFNGNLDPNFPKDAGIRMHLKNDGTYTMTGPGAQTQGAWKMEGPSELHLMDSSAGGVQRFAVDTLTDARLALRLMDEQNASVVLLYKAE